MPITTSDLAAELDVTDLTVSTILDQLLAVDGYDATVAHEQPLINGSGRRIGLEVTLTDDAAQAVRDALVAGAEVDYKGADLMYDVEVAAVALAKAEATVDSIREQRDVAIRAAVAHGLNRTRIAEAALIRRERLYQILDGR